MGPRLSRALAIAFASETHRGGRAPQVHRRQRKRAARTCPDVRYRAKEVTGSDEALRLAAPVKAPERPVDVWIAVARRARHGLV